jgi:hypothetical protein
MIDPNLSLTGAHFALASFLKKLVYSAVLVPSNILLVCQQSIRIYVNNHCFVKLGNSGFVIPVNVNMPVEKISWFKPFHESSKDFKTLVGKIFFVVNSIRGGMGY